MNIWMQIWVNSPGSTNFHTNQRTNRNDTWNKTIYVYVCVCVCVFYFLLKVEWIRHLSYLSYNGHFSPFCCSKSKNPFLHLENIPFYSHMTWWETGTCSWGMIWWPKPNQLIQTLNSECIQSFNFRINNQRSLNFILAVLVVASSVQWWHFNQDFPFFMTDSTECHLSRISSSFFWVHGTLLFPGCLMIEWSHMANELTEIDKYYVRAENLIGLVRPFRIIFSV